MAVADKTPLAEAPLWLVDKVAPHPKQEGTGASPLRLVRGATGTTRYGRKALEDECAKVAGTGKGGRNHTLNAAAFAAGQLVGGGELDRGEAETALMAAATQCGLPEGEARKTIASGLGDGEADPRAAPKKPERASSATAPGGPCASHEGPRLPFIRIRDGNLAEVVEQCEAILARADLPIEDRIFQRGGQLWRLGTLPSASCAHGISRPHGAVVLREVQKPLIQMVLAKHARFERMDARKGDWKQINPPLFIADAIMARSGLWPVASLRGIVSCPTIRPNGSLVSVQGYDEGTGYYVTHNLEVNVPDAPTLDDVVFALDLLKELLTGFPFVADVDRSVALAQILTAIVRSALDAVNQQRKVTPNQRPKVTPSWLMSEPPFVEPGGSLIGFGV